MAARDILDDSEAAVGRAVVDDDDLLGGRRLMQ